MKFMRLNRTKLEEHKEELKLFINQILLSMVYTVIILEGILKLI